MLWVQHQLLCCFLFIVLLHDINIWWIVRQILSEDNKSKGMATKVMQYEPGWHLLYGCKREKSATDLKNLEKNIGLILACVKAFS